VVERRRDVYARDLDAVSIAAAGVDVVGPKSEAGVVGLAAQEVEVVLADEELRVVYGINHRGY